MTLRHLEIFVEVARAESITKAAQTLYISQPTVSVAIREIEKHYGVRLFDRINQRIAITPHGREFLEYARHIIHLFQDMDKTFKNTDMTGSIRIGASVSFGIYQLPSLLKQYSDRYPEIQVNIHINSSDFIEQGILANEFDIAVIEGNIHSEYIREIPLFRDTMVPVCAPSHPFAQTENLDLDSFASGQFLLREPKSGIQELFLEAMHVLGYEVIPVWESTSFEALIEGAKFGIGIAVLPEHIVAMEIESGQLVQLHIDGFKIERTIRMIMHKNKYISSGMKLWMDMLEIIRDKDW